MLLPGGQQLLIDLLLPRRVCLAGRCGGILSGESSPGRLAMGENLVAHTNLDRLLSRQVIPV